jgi:cell division septum initiation protein DivIVA
MLEVGTESEEHQAGMESEILTLIDQLEELLSAGGRVPLSQRVMVPAPEAYHLLDEMRQTLPREIARARHIYQERERILQEAQTEAEALRAAARAEREALIAHHPVLREATAAAEARQEAARQECARLRAEADAYALASLRELQAQLYEARQALDATLKTTQGGIAHLTSRATATSPTGEPVAVEE